ncbi:unnamed protein product [Moneuplotes crassus]|uniref:Exportin-7/Ran-binding protein 17 TPR repeats domain-containing protein n=1 Tax=Euplotes crassus TaxID=5936 RepID=A0AAD1XDD6_EUPCR|nr:unnamed protein product [Moneuplotes crassus]
MEVEQNIEINEQLLNEPPSITEEEMQAILLSHKGELTPEEMRVSQELLFGLKKKISANIPIFAKHLLTFSNQVAQTISLLLSEVLVEDWSKMPHSLGLNLFNDLEKLIHCPAEADGMDDGEISSFLQLRCKIARIFWLEIPFIKEHLNLITKNFDEDVSCLKNLRYFELLIREMLQEKPNTMSYKKSVALFKNKSIPVIANACSKLFFKILGVLDSGNFTKEDLEKLELTILTLISCISFEQALKERAESDTNQFQIKTKSHNCLDKFINGSMSWCTEEFVNSLELLYDFLNKNQGYENICMDIATLTKNIAQSCRDEASSDEKSEHGYLKRELICTRVMKFIINLNDQDQIWKDDQIYHEVCCIIEVVNDLIGRGELSTTDDWNCTIYAILKKVIGLSNIPLITKFISSVFGNIISRGSSFTDFYRNMILSVKSRSLSQGIECNEEEVEINFMQFTKNLLDVMTLADLNADPVQLITILEPFSYLINFSVEESYKLMIDYLKKCILVFSDITNTSEVLQESEWNEIVKGSCWSIYMGSEIIKIHKKTKKAGHEFPADEKFFSLISHIFRVAKVFQEVSGVSLSQEKKYIFSKYSLYTYALMKFFAAFNKVYFKSQHFNTLAVDEIAHGINSAYNNMFMEEGEQVGSNNCLITILQYCLQNITRGGMEIIQVIADKATIKIVCFGDEEEYLPVIKGQVIDSYFFQKMIEYDISNTFTKSLEMSCKRTRMYYNSEALLIFKKYNSFGLSSDLLGLGDLNNTLEAADFSDKLKTANILLSKLQGIFCAVSGSSMYSYVYKNSQEFLNTIKELNEYLYCSQDSSKEVVLYFKHMLDLIGEICDNKLNRIHYQSQGIICSQIYNTILKILADFVQNIFPNDLDSKILKDLFNECLLVFRNFFRSNFVGKNTYKNFKDKKICSLVVKYVELISKINFEELYVYAENLYPFLFALFDNGFEYLFECQNSHILNILDILNQGMMSLNSKVWMSTVEANQAMTSRILKERSAVDHETTTKKIQFLIALSEKDWVWKILENIYRSVIRFERNNLNIVARLATQLILLMNDSEHTSDCKALAEEYPLESIAKIIIEETTMFKKEVESKVKSNSIPHASHHLYQSFLNFMERLDNEFMSLDGIEPDIDVS